MTLFLRPNRAFALLAAIGVLAVLAVVVVASINSTQLTYGFSRARILDRQLGEATRQAALRLNGDAIALARTAPFAVVKPVVGSVDDSVVTATVTGVDVPGLLGPIIAPRDGDLLIRLDAARSRNGSARRSAIYLVNSKGARPSPTLVEEARK